MPSIKITKAEGAPEGDLKVSIANLHFKVTDDAPYETDDPTVAAFISASYGDFLSVESTDDVDAKTAVREEAKNFNKISRAQDKAEIARAEKDLLDPAPEVPTSVDDLDNDAASQGGK